MSEKKIQVTLGNYKGVEVKKAEIIITEEEVKAELERARQYAGNDSGQRRCSRTW